jgi:phosphohistidine phosphatase
MSMTLILTRHAKSDWDDPMLDDHERPLNGRGRRSADAIGKWLNENGFRPDEVLCSTAVRTRETWERMAPALGGAEIALRLEQRLYHAGPQEILDVLRGAAGKTVLVLGHNPGIGIAAANLAAEPADHLRFMDYPTTATTVFRFDIDDWTQADWRSGTVQAFVVPRDLGVD